MNNEGAVVIEDTDFHIDNPSNDNPWTVEPNIDPLTKSAGGFFNIPVSQLSVQYSSTLCISMVDSKILSQVNNRLKAIMDNSLDFGGVSIICIEDFHQLRPVKDSYVFQVPISSANNYDGLVGPEPLGEFLFVELTEIMRQKDDQKFALALNNFANCCLTEDDINLFTSRVI